MSFNAGQTKTTQATSGKYDAHDFNQSSRIGAGLRDRIEDNYARDRSKVTKSTKIDHEVMAKRSNPWDDDEFKQQME